MRHQREQVANHKTITTVLLQVHLVASTNAQYYFGKQKEDAAKHNIEQEIAPPEVEAPVEPPPPPQPGAYSAPWKAV
jgi:hypothetical protein